MTGDTLGVWEFPGEVSYEVMAAIAQERIEEPDATALLVASRGDVVTLQLVEGKLSGDPTSKFYVERRGGYVLLRREPWPPAEQGGAGRTLLTLRAWPDREHDGH